jgi:uncharacterized protein
MESEIVSSFPSILKGSLGAVAILALAGVGARADEPAPSPAALGYATQLFGDIGLKGSLDQVVPTMLIELERNITATRPELHDPLHAALLAVEPEFVKTEDEVLSAAAKALTAHMSEDELKQTVAFFDSPAGKKFLAAQPAVIQEVGGLARAWRDKLSTDILARVREEMKKQGYTF